MFLWTGKDQLNAVVPADARLGAGMGTGPAAPCRGRTDLLHPGPGEAIMPWAGEKPFAVVAEW